MKYDSTGFLSFVFLYVSFLGTAVLCLQAKGEQQRAVKKLVSDLMLR